MYWKKKKTKPRKAEPRYADCIYCNRSINLDGHNWVVDGNGETLHTNCFTERWGITKEKLKNHAD